MALVCHCRCINDRVVRTAALAAGGDLEATQAICGAGLDCGGCIDAQVNLVPVRLVKGLELDSVIVVEPARIVAEEPQGLRSLYVALTRATQRLAVVHAEPLPDALQASPATS